MTMFDRVVMNVVEMSLKIVFGFNGVLPIATVPTGIAPPEQSLLESVTQEWLNEFERIQLMLRTSGRLRKLHGD